MIVLCVDNFILLRNEFDLMVIDYIIMILCSHFSSLYNSLFPFEWSTDQGTIDLRLKGQSRLLIAE